MDSSTRRALIEQYEDGYRVISDSLADISEAELDARPAPGEWSPREVVHHLADSEMTSAIRLRLLLAEDRPAIKGYDQEEFARRLYYDRPIAASLEAFRWARVSTAELLHRMREDEWARAGTHSESGAYSVEGWLEIYGVHAHEHAAQIREARAFAR